MPYVTGLDAIIWGMICLIVAAVVVGIDTVVRYGIGTQPIRSVSAAIKCGYLSE